jgi:hypothetical protein
MAYTAILFMKKYDWWVKRRKTDVARVSRGKVPSISPCLITQQRQFCAINEMHSVNDTAEDQEKQ